MKTEDIDTVLQRWEKHADTGSNKHYGFYVNGKLITVGSKRVYRRAGDLKNAVHKSLGIYNWKYSSRTPDDAANRADMRKYVDELLDKKIIEIKEV